MLVHVAIILFLLVVPCSAAALYSPNLELPNDTDLLERLVISGEVKDSQEGIATYYAAKFIGRRTSSGEPYHPDRMTAAHADLPLKTVVQVINRSTGKEVQVTINDRCRKRSFQLIDLSRAAAKKIGLWGKGTAKVRIIPVTVATPLDELLEGVEG